MSIVARTAEAMTDRIPLAEQLDEIASEYIRRCRAYPMLVSRGEMRADTAEWKIERLGAAHNTLAWLLRHADQVREWMQFTTQVVTAEERAAIEFDAPMEVESDETAPDEQVAAE
jgi:hypothetical protein